jgi:nucleoside-specific outer membrane channel protein Tsx
MHNTFVNHPMKLLRSGLIKCVFALALIQLPLIASAQNSKSGFLDFNVYPYLSDVDDDSVATINAAAQLPHRLEYFSLTNFGNQKNTQELGDTTTYYTEQNVRWRISDTSPLDLTLQMNFRTGEDNDRHRLGVRWRLNDSSYLKGMFNTLNLKYAINAHVVQFDNQPENVWQLEHSFFMKFPWLSPRLYLAGFIDHTFGEKLSSNTPNNPVVAEAQLGFNIIEQLYFVTEYRVNQYRRSDVNNLAAGIEYKIVW